MKKQQPVKAPVKPNTLAAKPKILAKLYPEEAAKQGQGSAQKLAKAKQAQDKAKAARAKVEMLH